MFCNFCGSEINDQLQVCPQCGANVANIKSKKKPVFKKWWFWIIIVVAVVVILGSLGGGKSENIDAGEDNTIETSDNASAEATDNSGDDNNIVAESIWEKRFYVDDFDEPTDEWYITTECMGVFSNSATTDSKLTCVVLYDAVNVAFVLYEYNRYQVKNYYSYSVEYTITTRSNKGEHTFTGYAYSDGDRVTVKESDVEKIKDVLMNDGEIKIYICETKNPISNYLFEVESGNLKDLLNE